MSDRMRDTPNDARGTTYDDRAHGAYDPEDVRAPAWEDAVVAAVPGALVAPDAPLAPDDVTGNLRRYARWQWRDFWERRGFWMAGAALLGVWLLSWIAGHSGPRHGPAGPDEVTGLAHALFAAGGFCAGLLSTGGIVARERERGLQRFLFAKPVRIVRYYLQGLAINGVGSLLVIAGAVLLAALVLPAGTVPVLTVLAGALMTYVVASGVTFLLSTLLRWDAPIAAVWVGAGFPIAVAAQEGMRVGVLLQWLFPQGYGMAAFTVIAPEHLQTVNSVAEVIAPAAGAGLAAAAYGLLCVTAGVAVLRRRSISA